VTAKNSPVTLPEAVTGPDRKRSATADESTERWLPYPGFAGFYEVSDWGNVMSLPRQTTRGKLLTPVISKKGGYRTFSLSKYGKVTRRRGARMVLETFDKPCPPGMEACHGPAGKIDRLDNLYWGTLSRNHKEDRVRDSTDNRGEKQPFAKLTDAIVLECRRRVRSQDNSGGETQTALAAEFGVSSGAMSAAINGRTWGHLTEGIPDREVDGRSLAITPEMRKRRREYGRKGAEARWG
jgi:hypothetical protein